MTDNKEKENREEQEVQRKDAWDFFWGRRRRPRPEEEELEEE
ncbi:hypothetical protein [Bacillus sp. JJ1562]